MKLTDELIKRMELDPYDDWDCDYDDNTENVGVTGIEQDIRDYFNMQPEDWPDSYINIYADINPVTETVITLEIHLVSGFDWKEDKYEDIKVPKRYQKKLFNQLRDSNADLKEEFVKWTKENAEEWKGNKE